MPNAVKKIMPQENVFHFQESLSPTEKTYPTKCVECVHKRENENAMKHASYYCQGCDKKPTLWLEEFF